jgi:Fe-Mn family superoxide dismutase
VAAMKERLSNATVAVQGSGWGWLGFNKAAGKLEIATCPNQVLNLLKAPTSLVKLTEIFIP